MGRLYKVAATMDEFEDPVELEKGDIIFYVNRYQVYRMERKLVWDPNSLDSFLYGRDRVELKGAKVVINTEITRKLYPNAEEFGEYLVIGEYNE